MSRFLCFLLGHHWAVRHVRIATWVDGPSFWYVCMRCSSLERP